MDDGSPIVQILAEAQDLFPGGVNSPVRAFKSVGGDPIVFDKVKVRWAKGCQGMERASYLGIGRFTHKMHTHTHACTTNRSQGAYCWDVDGNKYIDYIGSWGPAIVGAAHPEVLAALHAQLEKGTSFGAPSALENVLGRLVRDRVPSVEMMRFVNSGTEACLSVVRVMRAFTRREKILKFSGCYHGHADQFLVQAGSGVVTLGLADSPGVMPSTAAATLTGGFVWNGVKSVCGGAGR